MQAARRATTRDSGIARGPAGGTTERSATARPASAARLQKAPKQTRVTERSGSRIDERSASRSKKAMVGDNEKKRVGTSERSTTDAKKSYGGGQTHDEPTLEKVISEQARKAALTRAENRGVSKPGIKRLAVEAGVAKLASGTYALVREHALKYLHDLTYRGLLLMVKAESNVLNPKFIFAALELCDDPLPTRKTLQREPVFNSSPVTRVISAAFKILNRKWRPEKLLVRKRTRRLLRALLEQKIIDIFAAAIAYTRRKTLRQDDIAKALAQTAL